MEVESRMGVLETILYLNENSLVEGWWYSSEPNHFFMVSKGPQMAGIYHLGDNYKFTFYGRSEDITVAYCQDLEDCVRIFNELIED